MYKSQNKELLLKFKTFLKDNVELKEAESTYTFFQKKLYIDDLNSFLRFKTFNEVIAGFGNYNSNVAVILHTYDERALAFLKDVINKSNADPKIQERVNKIVDYNGLYITSFKKALEAPYDLLKEILGKELKAIKPKLIVSIGDYDIVSDAEIALVDKDKFDAMLNLLNKKDLTKEEERKLFTLKVEVWREIQKIIKCY